MSGHSHFRTIQHKKGLADEKRGKIFSKLARIISLAAKDGSEPETNSKLKQALNEAKKFNMPKDKIEKAIKRGTGEIKGDKLEEVTYEALGPNNINLIIECITDNTNRALLEIKKILQKYNGKLADAGSVKWAFDRKGIIVIKKTQDAELKAIEAGAEDIKGYDDVLEVYTKPEELEQVKSKLEQIESSSLGWVAKQEIQAKDYESMLEDLDDNDSVQNIYSNIKL